MKCRYNIAVFRFLALAVVSLLFAPLAPGRTLVETGIGASYGESCNPSTQFAVFSGSIGNIAVTVISDTAGTPFTGFPSRQPDWLRLEFSYDADSAPFQPSAGLYALLKPEYYLYREQIRTNEQLRQHEKLSPYTKTTPVFYFRFVIPATLTGTRICARAVIGQLPHGNVDARYDRNLACFEIALPQTLDDRICIMESHVSMAYQAGDDVRVVALTDSLLQTGWKSKTGLSLALTSSRILGDPQKSLRFLDALYQNYKVTAAGPWQPGPEQDAMYRSTRESLLHQIGAPEEQQR